MKSTVDEIRRRFDADVERFSVGVRPGGKRAAAGRGAELHKHLCFAAFGAVKGDE